MLVKRQKALTYAKHLPHREMLLGSAPCAAAMTGDDVDGIYRLGDEDEDGSAKGGMSGEGWNGTATQPHGSPVASFTRA